VAEGEDQLVWQAHADDEADPRLQHSRSARSALTQTAGCKPATGNLDVTAWRSAARRGAPGGVRASRPTNAGLACGVLLDARGGYLAKACFLIRSNSSAEIRPSSCSVAALPISSAAE
jgi:hypothetical protein